MAVFAIADLHLGHAVDKPMSIFGEHWLEHTQRLRTKWLELSKDDTVVIAGDISWALTLDEALPDLKFLDRLPGRKVLLRGNHDYWWTSVRKLNQFCADHGLTTLTFLRNNAICLSDQWIVAGTRGWILPGDAGFGASDEKIYLREVHRLHLSLSDAQKQKKPGQRLLVALHYPPFSTQLESSLFTELIDSFPVDRCVYGHIHGVLPSEREPGGFYQLVAADHLDFAPWPLV